MVRTGELANRRAGRTAAGALIVVFWVAGCGGGGGKGDGGDAMPAPDTEIRVELEYPGMPERNMTNSVHLWVLAPQDDAPGCPSLVATLADPYDLTFGRLADAINVTPDIDGFTQQGVPEGRALVFVEGIDYGGMIHLAGCKEAMISDGSVVTVSLDTAGAADCSASEIPEGTRCDDGDLCTVGEVCEGGECTGGTTRDCAFLADDCNAGVCDSEMGCVADPLPDGRGCDDGLACTTSDTCTGGECTGTERDCEAEAGPCEVSLGCSEDVGECVFEDAPFGTACDDGDFCTEDDQCSSFGTCSGTSRDCSSSGDQCNIGTCDEDMDMCVAEPRSSSTSCDDGLYCTIVDRCDGAGACEGTSDRDCSFLDDPANCEVGVCDEDADSCQAVMAPDGTTCNDSDACTVMDQCSGGTCSGSPLDADGDTYSPSPCAPSAAEADCNDDNAAVNPGATEGPSGDATCSDGLDNDCDGDTDGADADCA